MTAPAGWVLCRCKLREHHPDDRMCAVCWDHYCDERDEYRREYEDQLAERRGPRNNEEDDPDDEA